MVWRIKKISRDKDTNVNLSTMNFNNPASCQYYTETNLYIYIHIVFSFVMLEGLLSENCYLDSS